MCQVMQHYENIARNEGIKEGRNEGIKEGADSEKRRNAIEFMREGVDFNIISKCTGLTIPQLEQLLAEAGQ